MVTPDAPPPALITTVKPVHINPKEIWEAEKSPDFELNLVKVEISAMEYLTAREEKEQVREGQKVAEKNVRKQKKKVNKKRCTVRNACSCKYQSCCKVHGGSQNQVECREYNNVQTFDRAYL